jgi:DNA-directed RNA polymerase subunit RPC12/RpoP
MSVKCTKFSAWNWSPTMLIGVSPKFEYICGKCGKYNNGRFTSNTYDRKGGHLWCSHCGEENIIPVKVV